MPYTVEFDGRGLTNFEKLLLGVDKKLRGKVVPRALNRSADFATKNARKIVKDEAPGLRVSTINNRLKVRRANRTRQRAVLIIESKPIPLGRYGARQAGKGVTARDAGGGRNLYEGAFLAKGFLVARRKSRQRRPLKWLYGRVTPWTELAQPRKRADEVAKGANEFLRKRLAHELAFERSRGR